MASHADPHTIPECALSSGEDGLIDWASPGVETVFGRPAEAVVGEPVVSVLGATLAERPDGSLEPTTREVTVTAADGTTRDLSVTVLSLATGAATLYLCRPTGTDQLSLGTVLSRVSDSIVALDTEWRYTYVNEFAEAVLGHARDDLLGEVIWEVFPGAADSAMRDRFERAMETQEPVTMEWYGDSVSTWFEIRAYPSPSGMSVYFRDITDQKERETALQQERDFTEQLLDASPVGICVLTPDGQFVRVNERAEDILGVSRDRLLDESFREPTWEVRGPDGEELADEEFPFTIALRTGEPTFGHEQTLRRADGTRIWVAVSAAPIHADGAVHRVVVTFEDITERKETQQQFEAVFQGTLDALILADDEGDYLAVNDAACALFGLSEDELIGHNVAEFAPAEYDVVDAWSTFLDEGMSRGEFSVVRPDGTERIADFAATANVRPGVHLSALRDVTERKAAERRLAQQRDELRRLNHVNELIRDVNRAIVGATDRDAIEAAVCASLADSDRYPVATTLRLASDERLRVQHRAGLSAAAFESLEPADDGAVEEAIETAAATNTLTVVTDLQTDPELSASVRAAATSAGVRALGNVPIEYDGVVHGVLSVGASEDDAFGEREQAVFLELGQIIGTAIDAIQTKKLLYASAFQELELELAAAADPLLALNDRLGGTWVLDGVVPVEAGRYLVYVDIGQTPVETGTASAETEGIEVLRTIETDSGTRLELRLGGDSLFGAILDAGGWVRAATVEGGTGQFVVDVTLDTDVRTYIARLERSGIDATMRTKREVERTPPAWSAGDTADELTARQRSVLEAAVRSGYFDWPRRRTTGEELADALDIASSTLHQHLRVATAKILEQYFAVDPSDPN
ncbi:PAS domain S-box protein [Halomicroarcula sp. GCM10025709]|uniref:PAS domain S-box protein n=1 Tax=Haloarcula TaxID=2237 RepID=UPI0024C23D06|nr:PAS domain S-box protein [Halomicroarcula sp. YJ-61-S]